MKRNILFSKVGTGFVDRVLNVENDKQAKGLTRKVRAMLHFRSV
ncbi:unnamed protein product [Tenebrio molitor]|nr:unnamed protein product [Tenebrio molitor]